jgi:hypothetical protein
MARTYDDRREIPVISRWEDMTERERFCRDIDGRKVELLRVLAPYRNLLPHGPCGLSNCRTPNGSGYLIEAADGRETNIGRDCGKRHFPEFHEQALAVDRIQRERELRERAVAAKQDLPRLRAIVDELRLEERGATWVEHCVRRLRAQLLAVDPVLWSSLQRRAASGAAVVNRVRKLAKRERAPAQEIVTKEGKTLRVRQDAYAEERVGRFEGLEAFLPERDLHELVAKRAVALLDALDRCDAASDRHKDISGLLKELGQFDATIRAIRWSVEAGRLFFKPENLALLPFLTSDEGQQKQLSRIRLENLSG